MVRAVALIGDVPDVVVLVNSQHPLSGICYEAGTLGTGLVPPIAGPRSSERVWAAAAVFRSRSVDGHVGSESQHVGQYTCGGGPFEFFTVANGMQGSYNTVAPAFTNVDLADTWRPSEKFNFDAGIRFDDFLYKLSNTQVPEGPEPQPVSALPRVLFTNSFNMFNCIQPGNVLAVSQPNTMTACPKGFAPQTSRSTAHPLIIIASGSRGSARPTR